MFKEARIKLTLFYLAIIMAISVFFSLLIYGGAIAELNRIQNMQMSRRPTAVGIDRPGQAMILIDKDIIDASKKRIAVSLMMLNAVILGFSGVSGYFLAGKTLEPIKKNMDEQKEFIASASHELRTPLTSLQTEIEVGLRDRKLDFAQAKKMLASNLEDVKRMTSLSNYLLQLDKFRNRNMIFSKVDLAKVAKKAVGKRKVKFDLKQTYVQANGESLIELASILIDNAFKYSDKNPRVEISCGKKYLTVKDNGLGIPKEDIPHIFERFFRGDKARTNSGYGLGLSIAKQIADLHGASINVESKLGKGSTFKVVFS